MDRIEIKQEAKKKIKGNLWTIWKGLLVFLGLVILLNLIIDLIIGLIFPNAGFIINSIKELIILCLVAPLTVGMISYLLSFVRGKKPDINKILLKYNFDNILMIMLVALASSGLIVVGGAISYVPNVDTIYELRYLPFSYYIGTLIQIVGIIVWFFFAMSYCIIADGEKDAVKTLKKSAEMMNGYKLDYFIFLLSFIGWYILLIITLQIAGIWIIPYVSIATLLYYEKLKKEKEPKKISKTKKDTKK